MQIAIIYLKVPGSFESISTGVVVSLEGTTLAKVGELAKRAARRARNSGPSGITLAVMRALKAAGHKVTTHSVITLEMGKSAP